MAKFSWNEDNTAQLVDMVGAPDETITQAQLIEVAEQLGTSARSVGSKLRKMDYSVQKASEARSSAWSEAEEAELVAFLDANSGDYTYGEISSAILGGKFSPKQVQGKVLSLEKTSDVKPTEKVAPPRKYTEEQEAKFVEMAQAGESLEAIAEALGVSLNSARGKALALTKSHNIEMPKQAKSNAQARVDVFEGVDVETMTVEQLVEATGRTARGIRSTLSRRGLTCVDYDGAAKRKKLDEASAE
jgi:transposase|tara:strand:+ start:84615 stop:85349 length:735 start_codon:yes stop_codon:yes gene_type:complete